MNNIVPFVILKNNKYKSSITKIENYSYNKESIGRNSKNISFCNIANNIIETYFYNKIKYCIISKPVYKYTNYSVTIQLFYYIPSTYKNSEIKKDINSLNIILSHIFKKQVTINIIQLHYPYINSYIFCQYLAKNASTNRFIQFQQSILTFPSIYSNSLPAYINGIKVQISGRLTTETIIPRVTVKSTLIGSFKIDDSSTLIDYNKYTTKNELGAFTIKVWISQRKGIN